VLEQVLEELDQLALFGELFLEFAAIELSQAAQRHVEDGVRLDFGEAEFVDEAAAGGFGIAAGANELDDGVDGVERLDQSFEDVRAFAGAFEVEFAAAADDRACDVR